MSRSITLLHISDVQFGRNHRFGRLGQEDNPDASFDSLFQRLQKDLVFLSETEHLRPEAIIFSGDMAEWATKQEFEDGLQFLTSLAQTLDVPRKHVAIVPGNHDINRKLCEAYFLNCEGEGVEPVRPYWPKWKHFGNFFKEFYAGEEGICFTESEPWTLYQMGDLDLVVAGLNSTIAESHEETEHYGWLGQGQLQAFAKALIPFRDKGVFRLGVVHHNVMRRAQNDEENLRDFNDFKSSLGPFLNLVLHGHTHQDDLNWLDSNVPILSTGSAALTGEARPEDVANQYQVIKVHADHFDRWTRRYDAGQKRWIGDTRCSPQGDSWRTTKTVAFASVTELSENSRLSGQPSEEVTTRTPEPEERRIVQIDTPADPVRMRNQLKSFPRFRLTSEPQHVAVRIREQAQLRKLLTEGRSVWLVSDWGLGKEGFLASVLNTTGTASAGDVFRLQCGGLRNSEHLIEEAESQLGLSFQEFFAAVASLPSAVLVLDDLPHAIVAGNDRDNFERNVRPIFDFCPALKVIFVTRQEPKGTSPKDIVILRPLEIEETRDYLRTHSRTRPGLAGEYELERIQAWSGGLPMHLDRLLERLNFVPLSAILDEDAFAPVGNSSEPLPESLRLAVAQLANADTKNGRQSFALLKVLTVLRDGETFHSIRRFYERQPFYQANIDELVSLSLLEDVAISQTVADLTSIAGRMIGILESEAPKLLRVPRQVRDHVSSIISLEEREEIIRTCTGLFFGPKWWEGKIRLRTALFDAYGNSAIAGPGNEHLVARYLLTKALDKRNKRQIERYAQLSLAYCEKLYAADRFRDALIASAGIRDLLKDTYLDLHFATASDIQGRALRMIGRCAEAADVLEAALARGDGLLIDENKARIKLNLALAYESLDESEKALKTAQEALPLMHPHADGAFQANAIIAKQTLTGGNLKSRLEELEVASRNRGCNTAANNIALELARDAKDPSEALKLLQKVIYSPRDSYNRTRAIIEKATILSKYLRMSEFTTDDRRLLNGAYSYSYGQRIGNLLDKCHSVLWSLFTRERLYAELLRLFRFSSFIWRLRGSDQDERKYLAQLNTIDIEAVKSSQGQTLQMEIVYLERRQEDRGI